MNSDIYDEIIKQSNIQEILEYYQLNVVKNKMVCPFHKDTHPSMSIDATSKIVKCFSCGAGGNAISFIQKYEREINHIPMSIKDAMRKAIQIQNLNIVIPENKEKKELTEEQMQKQRLTNILVDAIAITKNSINSNNEESKKAYQYLENRNISMDTINEFNIGYSSNITQKLKQKYSIEDLIKVGLLKKDVPEREIFNGRITIPIFNESGQPVGFGARTLKNDDKVKYLNTSATTLFNKSGLLFNFHKAKYFAKNYELIVVEGYMDVISAKEMKFDNVVGTMGTAITTEQIKMMKNLNCEVILALDNDTAGKDAMMKIIPLLLSEGISVSVLDYQNLGNYKDFGDLKMNNLSKEQIYSSKISGFDFLMQNRYFKDIVINTNNIIDVYRKAKRDKIITSTKTEMNYKEYISNKTEYSREEIELIIHPSKLESESIVGYYKDKIFYDLIIGKLKAYAEKIENKILLRYIEMEKIDSNVLNNTLENQKYLHTTDFAFDIKKYVEECIFNLEDYMKFQKDKEIHLDNLLSNVTAFDEKGEEKKVELSREQKQKIIEQYNVSFDESIKNQIENNKEEFEELFIANNEIEFEKLFPKTYAVTFKENSLSRFKREKNMEPIRYALAFTKEMKDVINEKYLTKSNQYKTLLVFNNRDGSIKLSKENFIESKIIKKNADEKSKEEIKEKETEVKDKEEQEKVNDIGIFIKLVGEENETGRGIYIPISSEKAIYIPKQLYQKKEDGLELTLKEIASNTMSEYQIDNQEHTKKFLKSVTFDDFCKNFRNLYEIRRENLQEVQYAGE